MDPLSIAASIVALAQAASTITNIVSDIRDGGKDRRTLLRELKFVKAVLECVKDQGEALNASFDPRGPIRQLNVIFEAIHAKIKPPDCQVNRSLNTLRWPFEKKAVKEYVSEIERLKSTLSMGLQINHSSVSLRTHSLVTDIRNHHIVRECKDRDQDRREILAWLCPLNFWTKQGDVRNRRYEGTGRWLFDAPEFKRWLDGKCRELWCHGIPGAGKTVLASTIIDSLDERFRGSDTALGFVYCNYQEQNEQTVDNLIAALLRQLIETRVEFPNEILELHQKHLQRQTRPSLDELSALFQSMVHSYTETFLVIDALDECNGNRRKNNYFDDRTRFLDELRKLPPSVHLLITSRPDLNLKFENTTPMEIIGNDSDIRSYIHGRLKYEHGWLANPHLQNQIVDTIAGRVQGMFLLAQLHIESLQDRGKGDTSVKSLRKALDELPKASNRSLDETYTEALLRIRRQKSQDADLAERILVWLSCAVRPLTVLEIRHAMAVMKLDEDENDFNEDALSHRDSLTSVCGGLVVIDETSQNIRLVHYTTQEYLERNPTRVRLDPHDLVANACLSYLCMTPFAAGPCLDDESLESRLAKYALLEYASKYWGVHAQKRSQQHDDTVQSFLYQNNNVASSVQAMFVSDIRMNGYSQDFPRDTAPLWIAASFGLVETIRYCLGFGAEVDFPTDLGETALHRAAEIGHEEAVKLLVAHGASGTRARGRQIPELRIHYHSKPFEYKPKDCSLLTAAESGDMSRVLQFLERGSPEYNDDKGRAALHWAVRHDQEALAQALLANGANPNAMGDSDETLLMEAAHDKVSTRILRLLLDHGADPNIQDPRESHTALHFAIQPGNYEKIAALLEFGALVYLRSIHGDTAIDEAEMRARWAKNEDDDEKWDAILHILKKTRPRHGIGESALHLAAKGAHLGAVTALLDKSSAGDIDAKNWAGETALQVATNMNHLPVVEYLLVHGANVDISNAAGETALHSATVQGNLKVVKSIISRTADLNVCDHNGKSPLMYAGRIGNRGVVVMLLDTNKVDVNATDRTGSTVLMEASSYEHLDVVEKLLTVDTIEVNVKDRLGNSALALAAQGGDEAVVDRLLEADAYKDDRNNNRETPLMKASKSGYPGVVNRLLRAGVNVNANVESGSTARKVFCYHLTEDGHKIDIHFTIRGDTALILAAKYGHVTVVHHLLRADADMNARNGRGETALMLAAEYGHEMTVDLLLRAGSDVNVKGGHDEITALTLAADNKHHTIVDYLLRAGADVNVKLESGHHMGETALILAAEHEHSAVAELIPAIDKVVQTDSDSSETDDDGSET